MTPQELAVILSTSSTKAESRISVKKPLIDLASEAVREKFKASGDAIGHISNPKIIEIALLNLLDPDFTKSVLVSMPDSDITEALRNVAFNRGAMNSSNVSDKIESIYDFTRNLDANRRKSERIDSATLYSLVLMLRLITGQPDFNYSPAIADNQFNAVITEIGSSKTESWVKDIQLQIINILSKNKRDAAK